MNIGDYVFCREHSGTHYPAVVVGTSSIAVKVRFSDGTQSDWPHAMVERYLSGQSSAEVQFNKELEKAFDRMDSDFKRDALKMVKEANASLTKRGIRP